MRFISLLLFLTSLSTAHAASQLYHYTDANGHSVMSHSLPPEFAQKGYDVLDAKSMRRIRRVAPALSPEELRLKRSEEQQNQQILELKEQQELALIEEKAKAAHENKLAGLYDEQLLMRYQTIEDIEQDQKEYEASIKAKQGYQYKKLATIRKSILTLEKKAANIELEGSNKEQIDNIINQISSKKQQEDKMRKQLDFQLRELKKQQGSFNEDKVRFTELKALTNK